MANELELTLRTEISDNTDAVVVNSKLSALELEIDAAYEHAPFGSHTLDDDGIFQHINTLELAWIGYPRDVLIGHKSFLDFLTPISQIIFQKYFFNNTTYGPIKNLELDLISIDGTVRPILLNSIGVKHRSVIFDMTQAKQYDEKQRIATAAFNSVSGMFITDRNGIILQANNAFTSLTGYSEHDALGKSAHFLSAGQHDQAFYQSMWESLTELGSWQGEIINRRKNGQIFTEWLSISNVVDVHGVTTHYIGNFIDITTSKAAESEAIRFAYFDQLTQLPNRRLLLDRIARELTNAKHSGLTGAVLLINLDKFKIINDTLGHEVGDLLLIEVATRLSNISSATDCVARLNGDEFVLLLTKLDAKPLEAAAQARREGEKVIAVLNAPYQLNGNKFYCTASVSIDLFSESSNAVELLQHIDFAMVQSKKTDHNTLCFFDSATQTAVTNRAIMEAGLHRGLIKNEFTLYFQPQVNQQRKFIGAEALLRWQHPINGLILPEEFTPLAEDTGLISPIGQWVLESACAQLKAWEKNELTMHLQLAVNISAHQLRQDNFIAKVQQLVSDSAINPALLKLELTESMAFNIEDAIEKMVAINAIGVQFSIDDFGTGYASLSKLAKLAKLPLSQLKIDKSFVQNIGIHPTDAVIIKTIIIMAYTLGMNVIAEGVETEAQKAFLEYYGCLFFQGYLFGRPMPIDEFEALLQTN